MIDDNEDVHMIESAVCTHRTDKKVGLGTCDSCTQRVLLQMDYERALLRVAYLESGLGYIFGRGYTGASSVAQEVCDGRAKPGEYTYASGVAAKG